MRLGEEKRRKIEDRRRNHGKNITACPIA